MKQSTSITKRKQTTLVARKSRRLRRKSCLRREYKKLRSLLPSAGKSKELRHKAGVVDAAYQYICHLQSALLDKFSSRGIPPDLAGVVGNKVQTAEDVQALALYLIRQNNNNDFANNNKANKRSKSNHTNGHTNEETNLNMEENISDSCSSFDSNSEG